MLLSLLLLPVVCLGIDYPFSGRAVDVAGAHISLAALSSASPSLIGDPLPGSAVPYRERVWTINPVTGALYAIVSSSFESSFGKLVTIEANVVTSSVAMPFEVLHLEYDGVRGDLLGVRASGGVAPRVYVINPSSGSSVLVGSFASPTSSIQPGRGALDAEGGVLYMLGNAVDFSLRVFSFDVTTGLPVAAVPIADELSAVWFETTTQTLQAMRGPDVVDISATGVLTTKATLTGDASMGARVRHYSGGAATGAVTAADLSAAPRTMTVLDHENGALDPSSYTVAGHESFSLFHVENVPSLPSILTTATAGLEYNHVITVADADDRDAWTYFAVSVPAWLSSSVDNGDGTFTLVGTPGATDGGPNAISLSVRDRYGFVASLSETIDVTVAGCPEGSTEASPSCNCNAVGYTGAAVWSGTEWTHTCSTPACPSGSSSAAPNCNCLASGYTGSPTTWTGTWDHICVEAPCAAGTSGSPPACGGGACTGAGYTGSSTFNFVSKVWSPCTLVACPVGSAGDAPACDCNDEGYTGAAVWSGGWTHTCTLVPCPSGVSTIAPNCNECNVVGYTGSPTWSGTAWSACSVPSCPTGSSSVAPSCTCSAPGYTGDPQWDGDTWTHSCSAVSCATGAAGPPPSCSTCSQQGYYGTSAWDGSIWSDCLVRTCPIGSIGASPSCDCDVIGYTGSASWSTGSADWTHTCTAPSCPVGSSALAPACDCDLPGYSGTPVWDSSSWTHTCAAPTCPVGSSSPAPDCNCDAVGYTGSAAWSGTAWTHTCTLSGSCPAGSASPSPDCNCDLSGYSGTPTWDGSSWVHSCTVEPCGPGSVGSAPSCDCGAPGYTGSTSWDGSAWTACGVVSCPAGSAAAAPDCDCDTVGYSGTPVWSGDAWTHTCVVEACPSGSVGTAPACDCEQEGYNGAASWNAGTNSWIHVCAAPACPAGSSGSPPNCNCNKGGYTGSPNWDGNAWTHSCVAAPCGVGSGGVAPSCFCDVSGYAGTPVWDGSVWSDCTLASCPDNASGEPACSCDGGFFGTVYFDLVAKEWRGTCSASGCSGIADGADYTSGCTSSAGDGTSCALDCVDGYAGDSVSYNCSAGVWDNPATPAPSCTVAPCPPNADGGPTCTCNTGYVGFPVWEDETAAWLDVCSNFNDCVVGACSGHGFCVDGIDSYTCNCFDGYSGETCAPDPCYGLSVLNGDGGACNGTASGSTCDVPCHDGYSAAGASSLCTAARWSSTQTCEPAICSSVAPVGGSSCTATTGEQCFTACDPGHTASGVAPTCVPDVGQPTSSLSSAPQTCTRDVNYCPTLLAPPGGSVLPSPTCSRMIGDVCEFACDAGYYLVGHSFSECLPSGVLGIWNSSAPECVACPVELLCGTCDDATECSSCAENAHYEDFKCTCNENYYNNSGCIGLPCDPLPAPAHGNASTCGDVTPSGETCSITCEEGFTPSGASAMCNFSEWSNVQTCTANPCPVSPPALVHANNDILARCTAISGGSCQVECDDFYTKTSDYICYAGVWNSPECVAEAPCEDEPPVDPLAIPVATTCAGSESGSTCPLRCIKGHEDTGPFTCSDGAWSNESCVPIVNFCTAPVLGPGLFLNGPCQGASLRVNGECGPFACADGYELLGTPLLTCNENGTWSGEIPGCDSLLGTVVAGPGEAEAKSDSTVLIVLLVLFLLVLIMAAIIGAFVYGKMRKRKRKAQAFTTKAAGSANDRTVQLSILDPVAESIMEQISTGKARVIGAGGAATIYKGKVDGRVVAIKQLRETSQKDIDDFHQEVNIMTKLSVEPHPSVLELYHFSAPCTAIVMELADRGSLKDALDKNAILEKDKVGVLGKVVDGIRHLHSLNIVHNDIKHHNVLLTANGGLKISDFGVSESVAGPVPVETFGGTVQYAPRERLMPGMVDLKKADSYSLAVTAWALLTGREPYENVDVNEVIAMKRSGAPEDWSGLPSTLRPDQIQCIMSALSPNPNDRPDMNTWAQTFPANLNVDIKGVKAKQDNTVRLSISEMSSFGSMESGMGSAPAPPQPSWSADPPPQPSWTSTGPQTNPSFQQGPPPPAPSMYDPNLNLSMQFASTSTPPQPGTTGASLGPPAIPAESVSSMPSIDMQSVPMQSVDAFVDV